MKNIEVIRAELKQSKESELEEFIHTYSLDKRVGAEKLVEQARKKLACYQRERERVKKMRDFDNRFEFPYICGVDEVGRGPLAGPVVAVAIIFPKDCIIPYVNDSKKLSEAKREEVFDEIMKYALGVGTGIVEHDEIDEINILQATFKAMRMAIANLKLEPDFVLVDGNQKIPELKYRQETVVKGDGKSFSIAAASIVAKVLRDRQMVKYDKNYPMYDFKSNKGYNSPNHKIGLQEFGLSPIHRKTFVHLKE